MPRRPMPRATTRRLQRGVAPWPRSVRFLQVVQRLGAALPTPSLATMRRDGRGADAARGPQLDWVAGGIIPEQGQ